MPKGGDFMSYNIDGDLNVIQRMIVNNKDILALLDLTGATNAEIAKRIIKRSKWNDLATSDKRLCIYSVPARPTRIDYLFEELIEIDVHVPATSDYKARQIIGKVVDTLNNKNINGRYIKFKGQLGELSTMDGFYCHGVRFGYFSPI